MKILVVYPYFVDTGKAGHSVMYEAVQALAASGHEVTVVSGEGGYMQGSGARLPWWRRIVRREQVGGVKVIRTLSYGGHQTGIGGRFLSYLFLSVLNPLGVMLAPKMDVALLSPPPLYPVFSSWIVCRLRRVPVVLEVRDLWPGSIVQMGLLRNPYLIRITAWMERLLYNHAVHILALTHGIAADIVRRGWPASRVEALPCGVDVRALAPDDRLREVQRNVLKWQGRFVVLYFGALGQANNLSVILAAARRLAPTTDILLAVVGDGIRRKWLQERAREEGLDNLEIIDAVPKSEAAAYLNAADACVVTLQDLPVFEGAIPTKLVEYMACGKPVLCGVRGEAQRIVEGAGAGICFAPDDEAGLCEGIDLLKADVSLGRSMGERGRALVLAEFDDVRRHSRLEEALVAAIRQWNRN